MSFEETVATIALGSVLLAYTITYAALVICNEGLIRDKRRVAPDPWALWWKGA